MNRFAYLLFRLIPKTKNVIYKYYNRLFFKMIGVRYGRNMLINDKVYIHGKGHIEIGDDFICFSGNNTNPICRNIRGSLYVPYRDSRIVIGNRVGMSSPCIWANELVTIGNDVNIGGECLIMDTDAHPHDFNQRRMVYRLEVGEEVYNKTIPTSPVVIDDDVWIGARSTILKGVHIGARSIIAAGSVVTKDIPSDCIAAGTPCRVVRKLQK